MELSLKENLKIKFYKVKDLLELMGYIIKEYLSKGNSVAIKYCNWRMELSMFSRRKVIKIVEVALRVLFFLITTSF